MLRFSNYARLSTDDQDAALKRHGCKEIFTDDGLSGAMSIESRRDGCT
jgi:DNA invertase Pin-like site-specific DNA recombinase